jgi:hypothetical protein
MFFPWIACCDGKQVAASRQHGETAVELLSTGAVKGVFEEDVAGRILPFDSDAAAMFAKIAAARQKLGRPIAHFDAQVAAVARSRGAAVATRNTSNFDDCGISVLNPWNSR